MNFILNMLDSILSNVISMPTPYPFRKLDVIMNMWREGLREGDIISPSEFAEKYGLSTNYVYKLFRRWSQYGYLRRIQEGRRVYYEVTRKGEGWLRYYIAKLSRR